MKSEMLSLVRAALREDVGAGDITTRAIIPASLKARGYVRTKQRGLIAGLPVCELVFRCVDSSLKLRRLIREGDMAGRGQTILEIKGKARSILTAERTALNFLSRLSGIATLTREFVKRVAGTGVKIMDTRKTTPGLRMLEKYAVRVGGGFNHRSGLDKAVLIKDNHIRLASGGLGRQLRQVRLKLPGKIKVEIEVNNLRELAEALEEKADIIMLDNMGVSEMREAVKMAKKKRPRLLLEASGNVSLARIGKIAGTGVDRVSIGSLTHSAGGLDMSLEIEE